MRNWHGFCTFPFVKQLSGLVIVSKDYKKKSEVVIETDSIGYATSYAGKPIPADKIIPDIKKLMKTSQILQCKEDFEGVACLKLIVRF
jgi:hypothetical protein